MPAFETPVATDPVGSIYPLSPAQREILRERLPGYQPGGRWPNLPDPRKVVYSIWRFGIHPIILAQPKRFHARVSEGVFECSRTKTRARVSLPLACGPDFPKCRHPEVRSWAGEFFDSLPTLNGHVHERVSKVDGRALKPQDQSYLPYNLMVHHVGDAIGLPGLTPRTLRHTSIADYFDEGRSFQWIVAHMGTSARVLIDYATSLESRREIGTA